MRRGPETSSGTPKRPSGTSCRANVSKNSSRGRSGARRRWMFSHCGVITKPMLTALTRMLSFATSSASVFVNELPAARLTEVAKKVGSG